MTGAKPPPCEDFTLTMVDAHRAVLFGGWDGVDLKHCYVLDISRMVSEVKILEALYDASHQMNEAISMVANLHSFAWIHSISTIHYSHIPQGH